MKLFDLTGKSAVVVGGAGGLGQAIAQGLCEIGANVMITSRNEDSLKRAQSEIKDACGADICYGVCDATDEAQVEALLELAISKFGKVAILVNAQGFNKKHNADECPMDVFRSMLEANIVSVMMTSKHFGKHMMQNGYGKIVNLSSVRGKVATKAPGNAGYCTTKGAVDMLTKSLAAEFGPSGVTVNAIGPTVTETPMMTSIIEMRGGDTYRKNLADGLPMRRMAMPEDSVGAALFLCCPASDFVTGNIIYPDGGLTAIG